MRTRHLFALLVFVLVFATGHAHAEDWLLFRHDAQRTGATPATLTISEPAVAWRQYLGGALRAPQFLDLDVDGDGRVEIVYVSGGRILAKRGNNVAAWESPVLGVDTLVGLVDLDEDGRKEILATRTFPTPSVLVIVSSVDGALRWELPADVVDFFGGVRAGDLDGDGHVDLHVGSGRCGRQIMRADSVAYSFCPAGGACSYGSARELWRLTPGTPAGDAGGNCGQPGALGNVDGDPALELVLPFEYAELPIYAASTGTRKYALPRFAGGDYDRSGTNVVLRNLDADPALEIIANTDIFDGGVGARRVAVFDVTGGAARLLWELVGPDRANDRVILDLPGSVADLDIDGNTELVVSRYLQTEARWTTWVRNALTGAVLATLPDGLKIEGVADLTGDMKPELVCSTPTGGLAAFTFAAGAVTPLWTIASRIALRVQDHDLGATDPNSTRLFTMQLDADAAPELVVGSYGTSGRFDGLHAYDADSATPRELAMLRTDAETSILAVGRARPMTRDHEQPVLVTSDGYLLVLDRGFAVTNRIVSGEFTEPGMRVGGFYSGAGGPQATPLVAAFGAESSILTGDSRGTLLRFDARMSGPGRAPRLAEGIPGAAFPALVELDGAAPRELVHRQGIDIVVRRAEPGLAQVWRAPSGSTDGSYGDALPANLGRPTKSLLVVRNEPGSNFRVTALDGATGAPLWAGTQRLLGFGVGNYGSHAVAELTGDGIDDLVALPNSVTIVSGVDGTFAKDNGMFLANGIPLVTSVDGDASLEVFAHGGWYENRVVAPGAGTALPNRWMGTVIPNTNAYGALVQCGGAAHFVAGEYSSPSLFLIRASDGTVVQRKVLAAGEVTAALPAGIRPGVLGNATVVARLGSGTSPGVLIGSTDGYLYALDACSLTRAWSLDLRYPVGEPVVADANGDGIDEVLVTCADGNLYGIGSAQLARPVVRDTAPGGAATDDVDMLDTVDTLYASWDPVPGATSYLVGVFTKFGSELRFPNFRDVGNVTSATLDMLPLRQGQDYVVAVQALSATSSSPEGRSDGVRITDTQGPTATARVTPDRVWPAGGVRPAITGACVDAVGVARVKVEVLDAQGAPLAELANDDAMGRRDVSVTSMWDGRSTAGAAQPQGVYAVRVTCTDLQMREATSVAQFTLDPSAMPVADAGPPRADGGMRQPPMASGCGCRVTSGAAPGWLLFGAIGFAWLLTRRRR